MRIIRAFNAISGGKKGVKSLDKVGVATEQSRYTVNHTRSINATISNVILNPQPLTLEIFHDIKEFVVNIRSLLKLDFNLIKVCKRIFDVEWPIRISRLSWCLIYTRCSNLRRRRAIDSTRGNRRRRNRG